MLNAAVIGCGAMGRSHVRVYSEIEGINLIAVADTNHEVTSAFAKRYGLAVYTDYKQMISKEKIDIISVAVPTILHRQVALDCISNGINVLVEKPIASTVQEGNDIIEAASRKGVKLMIGHIERYNPAIIELKRRIDNGELGKVYKMNVDRIGPFPHRISDVGVVVDLSVHDIDIMRYLMGSEVSRLYAETQQRIHSKKEDILCALLKFDNGAVCSLNVNWVTPTKIRRLQMTGEKGMFTVDYLSQEISFYQNNGLQPISDYEYLVRGVSEGNMVRFNIAKKEPLKAEIEHFADCIVNGRNPGVSGSDGIAALEIAEKIIRSANSHVAMSVKR